MEFSWLHTFIAAAQYGNFRQASEILHISQPTVTVHIKLLEQELGVRLFKKEGRKMKLTEEGGRYLTHAKNLLDVYQSGLEDLESFRQGYTQQLSLAVSPLIADTILPHVLKSYLNLNPKTGFTLKILESAEIEQAVLNEEADLGLSCLPGCHQDIQTDILYQDPLILVAPHDGMDAEMAPPLDEEELFSSYYVFTHNHPEYWDKLCLSIKRRYPAAKMMQVSQTHITKRFISEGLGISFLPASAVRRELLEGRVLEVPCSTLSVPAANTYAVMKHRHSKQSELLDFISEYRI